MNLISQPNRLKVNSNFNIWFNLHDNLSSLLGDEGHAVADIPPATPLGAAPPPLPDFDSSYSSAVIQEFLQQAFSASQSQGAGQTWARSNNSNYQDSLDSGAHMLLSPSQNQVTSHMTSHGPKATGKNICTVE